jgi:hypothetical protein
VYQVLKSESTFFSTHCVPSARLLLTEDLSAVQCSAVQCSAVHAQRQVPPQVHYACSAVQCSAVLDSAEPDRFFLRSAGSHSAAQTAIREKAADFSDAQLQLYTDHVKVTARGGTGCHVHCRSSVTGPSSPN